MKFTFRIEAAHRVGGKIFVLDGLLEEGVIQDDSDAIVAELAKPVRVRSVGIGILPGANPNRLSIHIDEPSFSLTKIEGGMTLRS